MKTVVNEVLGFEIELRNIPETIAEAVEQAGSEAQVLGNHINYVVFHSHNTDVRDGIVEYLEQHTKIARKSHKDGEKTIIDETEQTYVKRLRAENPEVFTEELGLKIRGMFSEVDWTPSSRGSGKLAKQYLEVYDKVKGLNKLEEFVAKHGLVLTGEEDKDREIVGRKAKELIEAAARAAKEALV